MQKIPMRQDEVVLHVPALLEDIQASLLKKAKERLDAGFRRADDYEAFKRAADQGGFVLAPWCGSRACEDRVSEETKATIRLLPDDAEACPACMVCGKGPAKRVPFAQAY